MTTHTPIFPQLNGIAYGADFYPEQWDEETLTHDIALMKEMGVNLVSVGIFAWAQLEPSEGEYSFDWLGTVLDRLYENGIYVDLATATASPPAWMVAEHPEILPVTHQGVRLGFGSRQHTCLSSSYLRQRQVSLAGALAQRFGSHPAVVLWHVNNEYACHVWECFCSTCIQAFRLWLQARYGSVNTLNQAWGTNFWSQKYSDWRQVNPPAAMPTFHNPSHVLDWKRFCDHQLRSMFVGEYQAIRPYSHAPITTNFMGSHLHVDYRRWAQVVDVVANDMYPDPANPDAAWQCAWQGDLMRGLKGAPWILMEQAPGAVQWRRRNSPKRPGVFELWSLSSVARGADAVLQFQWRQSVAGAELFHSGMVPHAGRASRVFDEAARLGLSLSRLDSVRGQLSGASVAIVVDWLSEWALAASVGPVEWDEPFAAAQAWHRTLWEQNIPTDVVGVDTDFDAYSLIIVPGVFIDYPDFAAALERAVSRGAQVVVVGPSAVVDENLHAVTGGYGGSLREVLGVHVTDFHPLSGSGDKDSVCSGGTALMSGTEEAHGRHAVAHPISSSIHIPAAQSWCGLRAVSTPLLRSLDSLGTPVPVMRSRMWAEELALYVSPVQTEDAHVAANAATANWAEDTARGTSSPQGRSSGLVTHLERAYPDFWPALKTDVEAVAVFDGSGGGTDLAGRAAITHRKIRSGAAWYIACDLDEISRLAMAQVFKAYARVRPSVSGLPAGVEVVQRGNATVFLNHSDRGVELSGVVGLELVTGTHCQGHMVLAPRSGAVITGQG